MATSTFLTDVYTPGQRPTATAQNSRRGCLSCATVPSEEAEAGGESADVDAEVDDVDVDMRESNAGIGHAGTAAAQAAKDGTCEPHENSGKASLDSGSAILSVAAEKIPAA